MWAIAGFVLCLIHPPLAEIPGNICGVLLRSLGLRVKAVFQHFYGSLVAELQGLFTDFLEWVERTIWPFGAEGIQYPRGQRLTTVLFGFLSLRAIQIRCFGTVW